MPQVGLRCSIRLALRRLERRNYSSAPKSSPVASIAQLLKTETTEHSKNDVVVNGFVRSVRSQKKRAFASIGDGSNLEGLQAVLKPEQAQSLSTGTAVRLSGSWLPSPNPQVQSHELHVNEVKVIGATDPSTYPLQKKYATPEYLRTMPHLRSRIPFNSTLLRLRSACIAAATNYFGDRNFVQTHTPIITSSDCEGAGEVFSVGTTHSEPSADIDDNTFFKSPKYLTVSSQLHLEALAQSVGKVWTLSPTFRAEKSDTARHLSEFYMLEAEMSFVEDMDSIMDVAQNLIVSMVEHLTSTDLLNELKSSRGHGKEGSENDQSRNLQSRWDGILHRGWPRISYTEAIKYLQARTTSLRHFEHTPKWGLGLQVEHERFLAETLGQNGSPVFITHYPRSIKPFYMLASSSDDQSPGDTVDCFDLLVPETCEVIGGSMREHRLEQLLQSMQDKQLLPQGPLSSMSDEQLGELKWYIDLRRWGSVPHGGFGLGFDRLLGYLAGVPNIREVVTFPRWVGRCEC